MAPDSIKKTVRRIGVAGFMGAGKTAFARFLMQPDSMAVLINADVEAKQLMLGNEGIKKKLIDRFGTSVITDDAINFKRLGEIVFSNPDNLLALNALVHPPLLKRLKELVFSTSAPVTICDAALIPLWRIEPWFDLLIWVSAPFETRLGRLLKNAPLDRDALTTRMRAQQTLFRQPSTTFWETIENNDSLDSLKTAAAEYQALFNNKENE